MSKQNSPFLLPIWKACAFVACACMFTACETLTQQQQYNESAQMRTQVGNLYNQVQRLSARLDGVQVEREQLLEQMDAMQRAINENSQILDQRVSALEANMATLAEHQQRDKRELVDNLSKQMTQIVKQHSVTVSEAVSTEGYEHSVKAGQTLSEIAAAYGVTREAIIKANKLNNPDLLRVGQILFIPE